MRTETVVGDTSDFGIGRRVTADNWNTLRAVGEHANQRLCDAQAADAHPAPDVATFTQVTQPSTDVDGLPAPGLRFGDPRMVAVLAALVSFTHLLAGFANRQLVDLMSTLLDSDYTSRQATYDLRRLRRKGLIARPGDLPLPADPRPQTGGGAVHQDLRPRAHALPGRLRARRTRRDRPTRPLAVAWRRLDRELDRFIDRQLLAAA